MRLTEGDFYPLLFRRRNSLLIHAAYILKIPAFVKRLATEFARQTR
jgi:hypothetical protein